VFREHAETTRGRDLDITGLSYARLDELGPQQWPFRQGADQGTARLYADGKFETISGRARFVIPVTSLTAETVDARFPLRLTTGRLRDQWHGMSRTGKVAQLYNHVDEPRIDLAASDMERRQIAEGDLVRVRSRRGEIIVPAHASEEIRAGQAFIAMHWGRNVLASSGANELTLNAVDPYSFQPECKHAAIQIEKADLGYQTLLMRSAGDTEDATGLALQRMSALTPWLSRFDYAAAFLSGRDKPVVVLRIAHGESIPTQWLDELDSLLDLAGPECLAYADVRRSISKKALIEGDLLTGLRLSGEIAASTWLKELMTERTPTNEIRRWVFAPVSQPPVARIGRGRIICNCLNVSEKEIQAALAAGADLDQLQSTLKCGTSCGSCMPEIRRMVQSAPHHIPT
jgi:assimilatory nitrate reductase catalytic subunit